MLAAAALAALFASSAHAALSTASYDGARVAAETPIPARAPGVTGVQLTVSTPALTAPTQVQVFLPAGYSTNPSRRWPVTYYLHGADGDDRRFNPWYGDLIGGFPSIVVAPSGGTLGFYSDWYNGGAGGPPEYQTYDIDQLIPLIDANFRTIATREGRALIGESMGGYGVMAYAALYPDMFGAVVSMSGAVDTSYSLASPIVAIGPLLIGDAPNAIFGPVDSELVRWRGHNPADLAGNLGGVAVRVTTGDGTAAPAEGPPLAGGEIADCVIENAIHQMNVTLEGRLNALGIPHEWVDYGRGCHTIWNFRRQFVDALPFLEHAFAHPNPGPGVINYESIQPSFGVWGWQVTTDARRALEFMRLSDASDNGLTLTGSGATGVTTPPFFRGLRAVDVVGPDRTETVAPDAAGRLRFTVDLGPPHAIQQYTESADLAGENAGGYFTTSTVTFAPWARIIITRSRVGLAGALVCVRALGPTVSGARVALLNGHHRSVARSRVARRPARGWCARARASRPLRAGRYTVEVTGTDAFGHPAVASERVRLRSRRRPESAR